MNKIYLFALIVIASFSSKSQLTLTQASFPLPGDINVQHNVTNTLVTLGSSGTGQTWNYSGLNVDWGSASTTSYVAMSSVPNASLFPTGSIGESSSAFNFGIYEITSTAFRFLGNASATTSNCVVYSNPMTQISLPFSYGSVNNDTYAYTDGTTNTTGTVTSTGDGTGLLLTPGMSFPNTLKIRYNVTEVSITGTLTSSFTYVLDSYFSPTNKFALLGVYSVTVSSSTSTTSVFMGAQINRFGFVGIQESIKETDFTIYPNPTSSKEVTLNFNSNESDNYIVKIVNTIGQEVKTMELPQMAPGQHSSTIDLNGLTSGIYFITLKNKTNESIRKLVIE